MKISKLIYSEKKWTKNCLGETVDGKKIHSFDKYISHDGKVFDPSERVSKFSLYGAIVRLYDPDSRDTVLEKLRSAIKAYTGKNYYIAEFNNATDTKYFDIKKVLEIAEL